MLETFKTK